MPRLVGGESDNHHAFLGNCLALADRQVITLVHRFGFLLAGLVCALWRIAEWLKPARRDTGIREDPVSSRGGNGTGERFSTYSIVRAIHELLGFPACLRKVAEQAESGEALPWMGHALAFRQVSAAACQWLRIILRNTHAVPFVHVGASVCRSGFRGAELELVVRDIERGFNPAR